MKVRVIAEPESRTFTTKEGEERTICTQLATVLFQNQDYNLRFKLRLDDEKLAYPVGETYEVSPSSFVTDQYEGLAFAMRMRLDRIADGMKPAGPNPAKAG
ncbi:MAG: single-stranded DNA-binding protein [Pseudomonadota bacterium]